MHHSFRNPLDTEDLLFSKLFPCRNCQVHFSAVAAAKTPVSELTAGVFLLTFRTCGMEQGRLGFIARVLRGHAPCAPIHSSQHVDDIPTRLCRALPVVGGDFVQEIHACVRGRGGGRHCAQRTPLRAS